MKTYQLEGVRIEHQTERAVLFSWLYGDFEFWIPKSVVLTADAHTGTAQIAAWFAVQAAQIRDYEHVTGHAPRSQGHEGRCHDQEQGPPHGRTQESTASAVNLARATAVYKQLARKYHPDSNRSDAGVMTDINELWQAVKADLR